MNPDADSDQTHRIIEEVQKRPSLWNVKDKQYYNKIQSERDWAGVSAALGVTKTAARAKWRKLKEDRSKAIKVGDLGQHEEMNFLKCRVGVTRTARVSPAKPKSNRTPTQESFPPSNKILTTENNLIKGSNEEDEDMEFFRSLLPYLKRLPPVQRLAIRSELQTALLRELKAAGGGKLLMECVELVLGPAANQPQTTPASAPDQTIVFAKLAPTEEPDEKGDDTIPTLFALSNPGGLLGVNQTPRPPSVVAPPPPTQKVPDTLALKYYDAFSC